MGMFDEIKTISYEVKETILKVENVSVTLNNKDIIKNINFEIKNITRPNIEQGQVVSLIGRSGIGKSVLFSVLSGLRKPTSGKVLIDTDLHEVHPGEVGVVTQNYVLFEHRTVYNNLYLSAKNNNKINNIKDSIQYYTDLFDLNNHLNKFPFQLSGGQKQRTSIVQQILSGNKFILFDEPFSGLDCIMIDTVLDLLKKISIQNEYNTLIIVSHDLENCLSLSDTAFILAKPNALEAATIVHKYDLMSMGLSWSDNIKDKPEFRNLLKEVKTII